MPANTKSKPTFFRRLVQKLIDFLPGDQVISKKLISVILLINGIASIFVTTTSIIYDYKFEMSHIEEVVDLINKSQLKSLSLAVWNYDTKLLKLLSEGILQYKYMSKIRLVEANGKSEDFGNMDNINSIIYHLDLPPVREANPTSLGHVELYFNVDALYSTLFKKFLVVFFGQFIKAITVSLVLFYIFQIILVERIANAYSKAKEFDLETKTFSAIPISEKMNELDKLFMAINELSEKTIVSNLQLGRINADLEKIVRDRAKVIVTQEKLLTEEARMAAIGRVAGGIAHEINTPLSAAILKLASLKRKDPVTDPVAFSQSVEKIEQVLDRITFIINNMRNLSRDTSGEALIQAEIPPLISQSFALCAETLSHKNIKTYISSMPGSEALAAVRPSQFGQIIVNLIQNSIDAIESQTEKWIRVDIMNSDKNLIILFADSGPGLSPDIASKIFDPYYTTKDQGKGSGLGLSLSKKMLETMGGTISLGPSRVNTTFKITLKIEA